MALEHEFEPKMEWDCHEGYRPGVIWWSRLDDRYQVEVQYDATEILETEDNRLAHLLIFDHVQQDELLFHEEVRFGYGTELWTYLDVNVRDWRERAEQFVDEELPT